MKTAFIPSLLASIALMLAAPAIAFAQEVAACQREELDAPPRTVYRCANGLIVEAEAAAMLDLELQGAQPRPVAATITDKAALIEVQPGSGPFQILTPHAIAAVRGTIYIVDVTGEQTSVFMLRGEVSVSKLDRSETVTLSPGEGIDVSAGEPLAIKVWPQERADRLLARFAR